MKILEPWAGLLVRHVECLGLGTSLQPIESSGRLHTRGAVLQTFSALDLAMRGRETAYAVKL